MTVDASGQILITGHFSQTADLDPSSGVLSRTSGGIGDAFVAKLHSDSTLIWARRVGGSGSEDGIAVGIDGSGNVVVAGYYSNTVDFDPGSGVNARTSNGSYDAFALELTSGGSYVWAASVGGAFTDYLQDMAVSAAGAVYLAGIFQSTADFDPGPGTQNRTALGSFDMYVTKLKPSGSFAWVDTAGSGGYDSANAVRLGTDGRVYLTGAFSGSTDFDPSAASFTLAPAGGSNPDVHVWTVSGSGAFVDAWRMGGTDDDSGSAIDVLGSRVYTSGSMEGSGDYDPGVGTLTLTTHGLGDAFVSAVTK